MRRPIFHEFRDPPARLYQTVKEHVPVVDSDTSEPWLVNLARRCLHKDRRVRKEIVRWEDFEGPRAAPESAEEIRERLRRRLAGAKAARIVNVATAAERPTRRTLDQLSGAVATATREVCQQGGIFPPVEVLRSVVGDTCVVVLRTGPSTAHELKGVLEVRFVIDPLDAEATHVRLTASARMGERPTNAPEPSTELFVGEPSAPGLRDIIDIYLHAAFEAGLGTGVPPGAGLTIHPVVKGT
jgi:hypothetical protein